MTFRLSIPASNPRALSRPPAKLFIRPEVAETLEREALLSGDAMIAASNKAIRRQAFALLDEIGTLIGSEEYPFSECKNILTACISGGEFSLIPQYADSVFVGN